MSDTKPPTPFGVKRAVLLGWTGAAAFGAVEVLRVVVGARLDPGPASVAVLSVLALAVTGLLGAIPAGVLALVPPLRRAGGLWPLLVGVAAAASGSLAVTWFSDPAPFQEPWPLQGQPLAFLALGVALPAIAIAGVQAAAARWRAAGPIAVVGLVGAGAVAVVAERPAPAASSAAQGHPNVLLVTLDTTRADRFGAHPIDTSAFDRVAAEGARFDAAYAQIPVTGPSHATILSGQAPWEHGLMLNGRAVPADRRLLAEVLGERGYTTGAFVSAYVLNGSLGFDRGFDVYEDDFGAVTGLSRTLPGRVLEMARRRDLTYVGQRRGDHTVDQALDWLDRAASGDRPFFGWVHLFDPHGPYEPPSPYDERYAPGGDPRDPANASMAEVTGLPVYMEPSLEGVTDVDWVRSQYDGEVAYADAQLERLLDWLDDRGLAGDTLVVVVADHGEGLGEEGEWFTHGDWLHEHDLHVPFAMRLPGRIPAGTVVDVPVALADVAPSIVSWAGLPDVEGHSGADLRDTIEAGRRPHVVVAGIAYDREANRAARAKDPDFPPTYRMVTVRGPEDRLLVRESPDHPPRYWLHGEEVVAPDPADPLAAEKQRVRELLEAQARGILEQGSGPAATLGDADRAMLEALGYVED